MKNSGKFQNSMRAVTINSEFSLPGLTYVRPGRQKSSSQSDKPPLSLYFPLVRTLFYPFINGRPNGSSDFGYESATRRCTLFSLFYKFLGSKVGLYMQLPYTNLTRDTHGAGCSSLSPPPAG